VESIIFTNVNFPEGGRGARGEARGKQRRGDGNEWESPNLYSPERSTLHPQRRAKLRRLSLTVAPHPYHSHAAFIFTHTPSNKPTLI